jgi:hypothetical protein
MSEDASVNGNLTFDDVAQALGETDPHSTNAAKLRAILGRGGLTTIQKHLDKIRADQAAALVSVEETKVPTMPTMPDSVAAMWGAAYGVAMATVRARMDSVVQERDALAARLAAAGQDRDAWEAEVQGTAAQLASAEAKLTDAAAAAQAVAAETEATAAAAAAELAAVKGAAEATEARLSAELVEVRHTVQLTELKAQNASQALQVTIDRLTDQVGELKSLLHEARAPEAPTQ